MTAADPFQSLSQSLSHVSWRAVERATTSKTARRRRAPHVPSPWVGAVGYDPFGALHHHRGLAHSKPLFGTVVLHARREGTRPSVSSVGAGSPVFLGSFGVFGPEPLLDRGSLRGPGSGWEPTASGAVHLVRTNGPHRCLMGPRRRRAYS